MVPLICTIISDAISECAFLLVLTEGISKSTTTHFQPLTDMKTVIKSGRQSTNYTHTHSRRLMCCCWPAFKYWILQQERLQKRTSWWAA